MALTLQQQFEELQRKIQEEKRLIAERSDLEATLQRCYDDESGVAELRKQVDAEFAPLREAYEAQCSKLDEQLAAIRKCHDETEEKHDSVAQSIRRLQPTAVSNAPDAPAATQSQVARAPTARHKVTGPSMPASEKLLLLETLTTLRRKKYSYYFRFPVSLTHDAPGYTDIVKRPMDLATLETGLLQDRYSSTSELEADFKLIASNARLYNEDDSAIVADAVRLQQKFDALTQDDDDDPVPDAATEAVATRAEPERKPGKISYNADEILDVFVPETKAVTSNAPVAVPQHAQGEKHRRRPEAVGKPWSIDVISWRNLSHARQHYVERAGIILETAEGEVAAHACNNCRARGHECKVYTAYAHRHVFGQRSEKGFDCGLCVFKNMRCSLQVAREGVEARLELAKTNVPKPAPAQLSTFKSALVEYGVGKENKPPAGGNVGTRKRRRKGSEWIDYDDVENDLDWVP